MNCKHKVVWVYPGKNSVHCPVHVVDKYVSPLSPVKPSTKKYNFYLRSLEKFTLAQWYGKQVVGLNTIRKVISRLCKDAGIEDFCTNHSVRTGMTRLFQKAVNRKLIKNFTGHRLDAVDAYQVTSEEQYEHLSKILTGSNVVKTPSKSKENKECESEVVEKVGETSGDRHVSCLCSKKQIKVSETEEIGKMINQIVAAHRGGRAKFKLEIEFCDCSNKYCNHGNVNKFKKNSNFMFVMLCD